ncbi:MAG TPA: multidrug effflux MFS transporter [Rhizomicrobium sp.]|jgi:DHA1 family bicyclomycin/chloramphenicol resistance-like MFS transporter
MRISEKEFTLLMALLMSIVAISIDALLPSLGVIGAEMGITDTNRTQLVIVSIFSGMALGQLIAGPASDAAGRKPVLYAGLVLYLVGSFGCWLARDFTLLLAGRFVQGLGVACPYVTAVSVVRDKYAGRDMARMMSLIMMIFILVPAVAPSLGQAVMHAAGWRAIFLFYIAYSIVIGGWIALRLRETLPLAHRTPFTRRALAHGFGIVVKNRTTMTYMVAMGLTFGSLISYVSASRQIFQDHFGVGDSFALYFGGLALLLGLASMLNSHFVTRWGMRNICAHASLAMIAASAIFLALHLAGTVTLAIFVGYAAVLFFAFGMMFGNLNAIAMEPMGEVAGIASAIIGATSSVISLSLGAVIGQLYNGTLIPLAFAFLVLGVVSWLLIRAERRWHVRQPILSSAPFTH